MYIFVARLWSIGSVSQLLVGDLVLVFLINNGFAFYRRGTSFLLVQKMKYPRKKDTPDIKAWSSPRQSAVLTGSRLHDSPLKGVPRSCHGAAYLQCDLHGWRKCKRIVGKREVCTPQGGIEKNPWGAILACAASPITTSFLGLICGGENPFVDLSVM